MRSASFAAFLLSAALPSIATALTADSSTFEPLAARTVDSPEAYADLQVAARDLSQDPNAEHLQKRFWTALLTAAAPVVIDHIGKLISKKKGKRDEVAELLARYSLDAAAAAPKVAARAPPVHLPPSLAANVLAVYDQNGNVVYDKDRQRAKPAKRTAPSFGEVLTSFDLTKNLATVTPEGIQRRAPNAPPSPAPAGDKKIMALFNDDGSLIGYYPAKTGKRDLPAGVEDQAQAVALFNDDGSLVGVYPKQGQKRDVGEEADADEAIADDADFESIVEKRDSSAMETFVQDAMAADAAAAEAGADVADAQEENLVRRVVGMRGAPIGFRA